MSLLDALLKGCGHGEVFLTPRRYINTRMHDEESRNNAQWSLEWVLIKEAGLLPKLKFVQIYSDKDDNIYNKTAYIFDASLTFEEFKKLYKLYKPHGEVVGTPEKLNECVEEKYAELSKDTHANPEILKNSYWRFNTDTIGRKKSVKDGLYAVRTMSEVESTLSMFSDDKE